MAREETPTTTNGGATAARTYLDAAWAAFKTFHGKCDVCHGADPYCKTLGLFRNPRLGGKVDYDPTFGGPDAETAVSRLRLALIRQKEVQPMSAEVKAKLRVKGAEHRVEKLCPGDLFVMDGCGYMVETANGAVECWCWAAVGAEPVGVVLSGADLARALAEGRAKLVRRR